MYNWLSLQAMAMAERVRNFAHPCRMALMPFGGVYAQKRRLRRPSVKLISNVRTPTAQVLPLLGGTTAGPAGSSEMSLSGREAAEGRRLGLRASIDDRATA